jgi:hypothetical protein
MRECVVVLPGCERRCGSVPAGLRAARHSPQLIGTVRPGEHELDGRTCARLIIFELRCR